MSFGKVYNRIERSFKKMPIWFHLLVLLAIIFILVKHSNFKEIKNLDINNSTLIDYSQS